MKVKELIEKLNKLNPDLIVVVETAEGHNEITDMEDGLMQNREFFPMRSWDEGPEPEPTHIELQAY